MSRSSLKLSLLHLLIIKTGVKETRKVHCFEYDYATHFLVSLSIDQLQIGASEASPFLVMNVAILSVCVCVSGTGTIIICFLYLLPFTNFYVKAAHGHKS